MRFIYFHLLLHGLVPPLVRFFLLLMVGFENLKVTIKHFEDLAYVHVTGETSCPQPLVVYTESTEDRDLLMVRLALTWSSVKLSFYLTSFIKLSSFFHT